VSVSQPVLTPPAGGETLRYGSGSTTEIKVAASDTGGEYGAVLYTVHPGDEPPLHTHTREDELVYVIEGSLTAHVGDAKIDVGPGAFAALPRGVPHTITVTSEQAQLLLTFVPGGLERFFVPAAGTEPDPGMFGLEIHGAVPA
jgi:quercetin dioxygenase-like cupin family protein